MTHARKPPRGAWRPSLDGIADPSDLMRQLADLFQLALGCRDRACRMAQRCRGGDGPPCFHANRELFVEGMRGGLRSTRRFWRRQRARAGEDAAGPRPDGRL